MVDGRNGGGEVSSFRAVNHPNMEPAHSEENAQGNNQKSSTGPEEAPASKLSSKASSTRTSTPAASSEVRQPVQSATTPSATEQPPQSQPMTATTSTSSHSSAKENGATPAAAPYGTRSRNRPGSSRINYAEDVEMDFEMTQAPVNGTISEAPSRESLASEGRQSPGASGKKGAGAGSGNASWGTNTPNPKDITPNIPGTSTFSANPNVNNPAPQPKRRKNAANHATNGNHAPSQIPPQASTRRSTAMIAANTSRETNMMTFEKSGAFLKDGKLEADDGASIQINDQVYLICEPPGEPYYLCRIMEFLHKDNNAAAKVDSMRVNWYYRPRDVQRYNNDTRLVYATMHSDICPLTSLRGRCKILHRTEINDLDEYRKTKDCFWFNQVFDRFIHRWYDAIPTSQVINVPEKVKKALDERWKYVVVETSRVKELTSAVKTCKRCGLYCATNDSVDCAVCHNTYHMQCVRPPLLKKPSRGFAWACGPCSRAQEKKLEARRTPLVGSANEDADEEEPLDEEEEDAGANTTAPSPNGSDAPVDQHPATQAEIALAKMWPMRYLGIHCRVEDALQYDDRAIYPRASSRLGPRHQANVNVWHGRAVELVKPAEIKKRYVKGPGHKKETKLSKETVAAMEADRAEKAKRPKWVQDEPPGYVARGEDHPNKDTKNSARLMFKMPPLGVHSSRGDDDSRSVTEAQVEAYMRRAKTFAKDVGVMDCSVNFLDKCMELFAKNNYDADAALNDVKKLRKVEDLHEPNLTKEQMKKWDEGAAKYGSEIRSIRLHVGKSLSHADAVRYYYMWKKTPKGREIWGSNSNRKGRSKKAEADTTTRLLDDIAHDFDDSAFDNEKAEERKRSFQCKFCSTRASRQWRRAPGATPGQTVSADGKPNTKDRSGGFVVALCQRCANLWRKYAVKWENTDEIAKKVAQGGGKAWKRRIDEELLREVYAANEAATMNGGQDYADVQPAIVQPITEPPRKKQKIASIDKDSGTMTPNVEPATKKKEKEKVVPPPRLPTPPPVPSQPKLRILPCAVCTEVEPQSNLLECTACKMSVHRGCYGVDGTRLPKWYCDMCKNDKKESVSYNYECVLCPVKVTEQELYEPPKVSHKKKTDREREKERLEKELVDKAKDEYRRWQQEKGRPDIPREPLKRTADNNWVHVHCAIWLPEPKFTTARTLDLVEGIGAPTLRYDQTCKLCKTSKGACTSCLQCHASFHVGCARDHGYIFGFDIAPVKATRRDAIPTVQLGGEDGLMTAQIWCKEHSNPKTIVHSMSEETPEQGLNALQLYAQTYKQADLALTGTARKANLVDQSTRTIPIPATAAQGNRRTSTTNPTPTSARGRPSNAGVVIKEEEPKEDAMPAKPERTCARCHIDASPRWWKIEEEKSTPQVPNNTNRVVDGLPAPNGIDRDRNADPRPSAEHSHAPDKVQNANGSVDHVMTDAPPVGAVEQPAGSNVNADVSVTSATAYLCQKCHWKKLNAPDEPDEPERAPSQIPEAPQLPLRSPPVQPYAPPPLPPWMPGAVSLPPQQPHIMGGVWPGHGPPLPNGIGHPPQPGPPLPHHQGYHAPPPYPMHQANGYPPRTGPGIHHGPPPPPVSLRSPYPPVSAPQPAPLHLNNGMMGPMTNGMHSPHLPYSPTHPPPGLQHHADSPYAAPQAHAPYPGHHGSPGPGPVPGSMNNRPSTPRDATMRDATMRDAPAVTAPNESRLPGGASASPSLRNLLH